PAAAPSLLSPAVVVSVSSKLPTTTTTDYVRTGSFFLVFFPVTARWHEPRGRHRAPPASEIHDICRTSAQHLPHLRPTSPARRPLPTVPPTPVVNRRGFEISRPSDEPHSCCRQPLPSSRGLELLRLWARAPTQQAPPTWARASPAAGASSSGCWRIRSNMAAGAKPIAITSHKTEQSSPLLHQNQIRVAESVLQFPLLQASALMHLVTKNQAEFGLFLLPAREIERESREQRRSGWVTIADERDKLQPNQMDA
ncbi:unnamed protein product, partial [Urochloa humidicola]